MCKAKWFVVFLAVVLIAGATYMPAGARTNADEGSWITLTPAEIQTVQQYMLAGMTENARSGKQATGQWDSNWESWLNNWSRDWGYQTLKNGQVYSRALSQMGYVQRYGGSDFIILTDADPNHPAEWLTLSEAEVREIQKSEVSGCPQCQVTGHWDSNWEKFLNNWSAGWQYRTLSGGRINTLSLGQMGYVANVDGKWTILEGQPPNPGEGGNWITLISSDTLKLQQALKGVKPDLFGALNPIGAWDLPWAQALDAWGKSEEWKPANWNPQQKWLGVELLNERSVAPALLERLSFSRDEKGLLVSNGTPAPAPSTGSAPSAQPIAAGASGPSAQSKYSFKLGFKALADQIPQVVGQPLEDEHWGANGDSLQQTTTGLMVWRKADNWTAFTNGSRTWINGPNGVQDRANDERFDWES